MDVITYPCRDWNQIVSLKGAPGYYITSKCCKNSQWLLYLNFSQNKKVIYWIAMAKIASEMYPKMALVNVNLVQNPRFKLTIWLQVMVLSTNVYTCFNVTPEGWYRYQSSGAVQLYLYAYRLLIDYDIYVYIYTKGIWEAGIQTKSCGKATINATR